MNSVFQKYPEAVDFYNTPIVKRRLESDDPVRGAFECAYFDTQRTFFGMGKTDGRENIKQDIFEVVADFYNRLVRFSPRFYQPNCEYSKADFDGTHQYCCQRIINVGTKYCFTIYYGQAQKIINMFFKYILLVDERLNCYINYFHIPLDGIMLRGIIKHYKDNTEMTQLVSKCMPWSRINDYSTYLSMQKELRKLHECPIVFEFTMWQQWKE